MMTRPLETTDGEGLVAPFQRDVRTSIFLVKPGTRGRELENRDSKPKFSDVFPFLILGGGIWEDIMLQVTTSKG